MLFALNGRPGLVQVAGRRQSLADFAQAHSFPCSGVGASKLLGCGDDVGSDLKMRLPTLDLFRAAPTPLLRSRAAFSFLTRRVRSSCENTLGKIKLGPSCVQHFVSPGRGNDDKLERPRCQTSERPQLLQKRRHFVKRHCGVVLDTRDLRPPRQKLVEMTPPSRWVLAAAGAARLRPIQHGFNSTS